MPWQMLQRCASPFGTFDLIEEIEKVPETYLKHIETGTTKSYISKIENDIKEVRISTLQKIVEDGLGGRVQLSIKL
jgi:transcriptional regulator with XRE-family HTH domain